MENVKDRNKELLDHFLLYRLWLHKANIKIVKGFLLTKNLLIFIWYAKIY